MVDKQETREGVKNDQGKIRMDLIPPDVEEALARILTHGAKKYADRNWEKGMDWSRVYGAARRHLAKFWKGDDIDPEFGELHIDHALCCVAFLCAYAHRGVGNDDRKKLVV